MTDNIFGTYEWATHTINIINGCIHDCKYCYSKEMAIRFKRKEANNWKIEELSEKLNRLSIPEETGTVMFPSSHDLSPVYIEEEKRVIKFLLSKNKKILLVTKPHIEVIRAICNEFKINKESIKFRFTIGSSNNNVLQFWEPGAPDFYERIESLKLANKLGFSTSVSCEPMLDNCISELVESTIEHITDAFWIGKPNFLLRRLKVNGYDSDTVEQKKAISLLDSLNFEYINSLYTRYKYNPKIKWKESIKKIVGLKSPEHKGMDK